MALTVVFGLLIHFPHARQRGRPKEPKFVTDQRLRYGQVVKQREGRRLVAVTWRVVFWDEELVSLNHIPTSLLERLDGTIRQHIASLRSTVH